jgi:hypothetical protein
VRARQDSKSRSSPPLAAYNWARYAPYVRPALFAMAVLGLSLSCVIDAFSLAHRHVDRMSTSSFSAGVMANNASAVLTLLQAMAPPREASRQAAEALLRQSASDRGQQSPAPLRKSRLSARLHLTLSFKTTSVPACR